MSAKPPFDVIVVGLGPAGASAAAAAAKKGARVLGLDRRQAPGFPVQCAEFVPAPLAHDIPAVGQARLQSIRAMHNFVEQETLTETPDFQGHMIDRQAFDRSLLDEAQAHGAQCRFGMALHELTQDGRLKFANCESLSAPILIAADGPRSIIGKAVGLANQAIVESRQICVDLLRPHQATDIFLKNEIEGGYAWLFPKLNRCNLGLGLCPSRKDRLKPLLDQLHQRLIAEGRVGEKIHSFTGGAIPVGGISGLYAKHASIHVLLAGDAAGLVNPITGAGINMAVLSGRLAGQAAASLTQGNAQAAADYAEEIEDGFGPSLNLALARRAELSAIYASGQTPTTQNLRRAWIGFSDYWRRETSHDMLKT